VGFILVQSDVVLAFDIRRAPVVAMVSQGPFDGFVYGVGQLRVIEAGGKKGSPVRGAEAVDQPVRDLIYGPTRISGVNVDIAVGIFDFLGGDKGAGVGVLSQSPNESP